MIELNDFYNNGFGWICRRCERELPPTPKAGSDLSRAFREGEAESKSPAFANAALAKWMDNTHRVLICPRCGLTEAVDKS